MVRLELQYLYEIGRAKVGAEAVLGDLRRSIGLSYCARPFTQIIETAERFSWTRDPFDRIIVAQAAIGRNLLVTKDSSLLETLQERGVGVRQVRSSLLPVIRKPTRNPGRR